MKTFPVFEPSESALADDIVRRFAAHNEELIAAFQGAGASPEKTALVSPTAWFVAYSLADLFAILAVHEQRHIIQAERVTTHPNFPRSREEN